MTDREEELQAALARIRGMCGIPDPVEACRLILRYATAALAGDASPWLPIATAPLDGTRVDLWTEPDEGLEQGMRGRVPDCAWSPLLRCWWERSNDRPVWGIPTHWMPKPEGPR